MQNRFGSSQSKARRRALRSAFSSIRGGCVVVLTAFSFALGVSGALAVASAEPARPADLYQGTNIWTVRLRFTADQWEAMEPAGGGGGFFGVFGGGQRGPGGPGGPGGRRGGGPGGPGGGGFGPAMLLAPAFLKQGDKDQDGKLSADEFHALGEKWFAEWDKEKNGQLNADQLKAGLNSVVESVNVGGPGPGGGGGRGSFLQGAEGKRNGLASAAGIEFKYVHADLEFGGQQIKDMGIRYKGNGTFMESRGSLKRSLKIDLGKYDKGRKMSGVSRLNLHNNVTDASWMNEPLAYRLFRDAGVPAPRTAYARVYVTVPGKYDQQYFGLYSLVEEIDRHFAGEFLGGGMGAIFKPVTQDLFGDLGDDWKNYNQSYDPKTNLSAEQKSRVMEFSKLVTSGSDADFSSKLADYVDLEKFARFMAVNVGLANFDSILDMGQNFYVYLDDKTHRFQFLPWDLDHSFGQFGMRGTREQRENLSINHPWSGQNRFLERVFKVEAFKKLYLARLDEFNKTIFQPARIYQQVDDLAVVIRPAVKQESNDKLERFDQVVAGQAVPATGFGGGFMQPPHPIKPFITARAKSVTDQLTGKSEGQSIEGFGFGGGGGRGGGFGFGGPGGRPQPGGAGGPGGPGPGNFLGNAFLDALDAKKDGVLTKAEFTRGFDKWFTSWNVDKSGVLTDEQLRAGINRDMSPAPGGPGFGPPNGQGSRQP